MDSSGSAIGPVAGSFKHVIEPSASKIGREGGLFLDKLRTFSVLKGAAWGPFVYLSIRYVPFFFRIRQFIDDSN
jgi:hypothetical protein